VPETIGGYAADEICLGCHEATMMPPRPDAPPSTPTIHVTMGGINPTHGACGGFVSLQGDFFGDEHGAGYRVQMRLKGTQEWHDLPVYLWRNTVIKFKIPCWTFLPGDYVVRVITPTGKSNRVRFVLNGRSKVTAISPAAGSCQRSITLSGIGFGNRRSQMCPDGYNGVHHVVDITSLWGTYSALNYTEWTDNSIKVKLDSLFVDADDTHAVERNFVQDDSTGACPEEPAVDGCDSLPLGVYAVSLKAVYFGDEDASGDLSGGDTIFQVVDSEPVCFELIAPPSDAEPSETIELKMFGGDGTCFISTALDRR
jgi:hypothetical protein